MPQDEDTVMLTRLYSPTVVMDEGLTGSSTVQFPPEQQAYYDHLTLLPFEIFWCDHQEWLAEKGYMLRPRYRPDWVPSWKGIGDNHVFYEDGVALNV